MSIDRKKLESYGLLQFQNTIPYLKILIYSYVLLKLALNPNKNVHSIFESLFTYIIFPYKCS